ncbi:MAG: hypothetical protein KL787_00770 [Taibaiella sp.]|nr:hypothetical protein [Taibaiella sp.]
MEDKIKTLRIDNNNLIKFKNPVLGNDSLISMLDNRAGTIYIYNYITDQFTDSFDIQLLSYQFLFNYEIIDTDKVLIVINPTYLDDYHDSAIVIINRDKEILKTFSFEGTKAPLYNERDPKGYRNTKWWYVFNSNFPVRYNAKDKSVLACLNPFHNKYTCSSLSELSDESVLYRLTSESPAKDMSILVPACSKFSYQSNPSDEFPLRPYGDYNQEGLPIIGFNHSDLLFYNGKESKPQLELYQYLTPELKLSYIKLVYDQYRKCYWWVINIKNQEIAAKPQYKIEHNYYLVRLDKDLRVQSEGFLPPYSHPHITPLMEGLMVKDIRRSDSASTQVYSILAPNDTAETEMAIKQRLAQLSKGTKKDLTEFAQWLRQDDSTQRKFLLIPLDRMPPKFSTSLQEILVGNKARFSENSIHLFTSDSSKILPELKNFVSTHDLFFLKKYYDDFGWPQILKIDPTDNGQILVEEYPSNKANQLIREIKEW